MNFFYTIELRSNNLHSSSTSSLLLPSNNHKSQIHVSQEIIFFYGRTRGQAKPAWRMQSTLRLPQQWALLACGTPSWTRTREDRAQDGSDDGRCRLLEGWASTRSQLWVRSFTWGFAVGVVVPKPARETVEKREGERERKSMCFLC